MKATSGGNFKAVKLPKPTTTIGRCYSLIDIGNIPDTMSKEPGKTIRKITITWELPEYKAVFNDEKGPEPFVVSEELTLSTNEKSNLAKLISAWRNKPFTAEEQKEFDPTVMVGKTGLIQFAIKTKAAYRGKEIGEITNENSVLVFAGIMKRPDSMEAPAAINPKFVWDWEPVESGKKQFDVELFEKIPNFIKAKIMTSEQYIRFGPRESQGESQAAAATPPAQAQAPASNAPVAGDDW